MMKYLKNPFSLCLVLAPVPEPGHCGSGRPCG